tara:strand:- start:988 stop:1293 length:306 start_codon:yes stop_codon:yes gene_type:complete
MFESTNMRLYLISAVSLVQILMFYFSIRIIISKISNDGGSDFNYFKEKKDNIYSVFQFLMYILLILIFLPSQMETINISKNESRLLFALGVLGLINIIANY